MTAVWVLLVAGLILVAAEVFLPGMIAGTLGTICLIASVVLCYTKKDGLYGSVYLVAVIVVSFTIVGVTMHYFPRTRLGSKMVLDAQSKESDDLVWLATLRGKRGTAHTMLRPAGTAIIENRRVDVVTEGGMVPKGSAIEVLAVEGNRVVVRKV